MEYFEIPSMLKSPSPIPSLLQELSAESATVTEEGPQGTDLTRFAPHHQPALQLAQLRIFSDGST